MDGRRDGDQEVTILGEDPTLQVKTTIGLDVGVGMATPQRQGPSMTIRVT